MQNPWLIFYSVQLWNKFKYGISSATLVCNSCFMVLTTFLSLLCDGKLNGYFVKIWVWVFEFLLSSCDNTLRESRWVMSDYWIELREWHTSLLPLPLMVIIDNVAPNAQCPLWVVKTMCKSMHICALRTRKSNNNWQCTKPVLNAAGISSLKSDRNI